MKCMHINIRQATLILLTVLINRIHMENDHLYAMYSQKPANLIKMSNLTSEEPEKISQDIVLPCPSDLNCNDLHERCITCNLTSSCRYGAILDATCEKKTEVNCKGDHTFKKTYMCRYCYQTDHWEHSCELMANCNSVASPRATYITNCTVKDDILCLGQRTFKKKLKCNWTGGYKWTTALLLSVTLGGFGADRFYLGHWQEGIGKLFSFGGLGVWTIIDVILISLHYLGPADGSLYI